MAEQQPLFRQGALTAWYEAAKPALYVNRTLREWLQTYAESQRPEAVKLALIYGIVCLHKSFPNKVLSIDELRQATENGHHAVKLSEQLPALKEGVADLQQMLKGFDQELLSANLGQPPQTFSGQVWDRTNRHSPLRETVDHNHIHMSPGIAQHKIYPSWWGEHQNQPASQHDKGPEQQPRPPPRLAYSLHQKPHGEVPLHSNDLITTEYLDVPSSGYGAVCGPQPAGHALVWVGSGGTTRNMPCSTQPMPGKENSAGNTRTKPLELKQHMPVKSKVKQQLQQARALHEHRGKARQQRLHAAVEPRRPPAPQRFQSLPGARSCDRQYGTEQPATDIADSILTNPWTAALVQDDTDMPQLYCNSTALTRVGLGSWAPDGTHTQNCLPNGQEVRPTLVAAGTDEQGAGSTGEAAVCSEPGSEHNARTMPDCGSPADSPPEAEDETSCQAASRAGKYDRDGHNGQSPATTDGRPSQRPQSASPISAQHQQSVSALHASKDGSPHTNRAFVQQMQSSGTDHWAAAFTSKHGRQKQGPGLHAEALCTRGISGGGQGSAKQRGFTSWIGDFGHLKRPSFNKQQGRAWQAHMRSQRDLPDADHGSGEQPEDDPKLVSQETQSCHAQSEEDAEEGSETSDANDGRWDFAKILGQHA